MCKSGTNIEKNCLYENCASLASLHSMKHIKTLANNCVQSLLYGKLDVEVREFD